MPIINKLIEQFHFGSSQKLKIDALVKLSQFVDNEEVLEFFAKNSNNEDDEIRSKAVDALGNFKDIRATHALLKALQDTNWDIRRKATSLLGKKGNVIAVEHLIQLLDENDWDIKKNAIEALGKIGENTAFPYLVQKFDDENEFVRKASVEALGHLGNKDAVSFLQTALKDRSFYVRACAAKALAELKDFSSIDVLVVNLSDDVELVRKNTAEGLGELCQVCIKNINASIVQTRQNALECLGKIGTDQAVDALLNTLNDPDILVHRSVIDALGKSTNARAVMLLSEITNKDKDVLSRVKAVTAIGKIDDKRRIPAILNALKDDHELVRVSAIEVIDEIGDDSLTDYLVPLCRDVDDNVRFMAVKILGEFGNPNAVDSLKILLKDNKFSNVQNEAMLSLKQIEKKMINKLNYYNNKEELKETIKILAKIGNSSSIEPLLLSLVINDNEIQDMIIKSIEKIPYDGKDSLTKALQSDNEIILLNTINTIQKNPEPDIIPYLVDLLKSNNENVCRKLKEVILSYKEQAINSLIFALSDENDNKKTHAADLLGNYEDLSVISTLITALQDKSHQVRHSVTKSLGNIGNYLAISPLQKMLSSDDEEISLSLSKIYQKQREFLKSSSDLRERIHALESLGTSNNIDIILNDILPLIWDKEKLIQKNVIKILTRYKESKIVKPLLSFLESNKDEELQPIIKEALINLEEVAIQPMLEYLKSCNIEMAKKIGNILNETGHSNLLFKLLETEDLSVKEKIIHALSTTNDELAFNYLIQALNNTDITICLSAISALGESGNNKAIEPLIDKIKQIETEDSPLSQDMISIKKEIVKALAKIGDFRGISVIEDLCNSSVEDIRHTSISALGSFKTIEAMNILINLLTSISPQDEKHQSPLPSQDTVNQSPLPLRESTSQSPLPLREGVRGRVSTEKDKEIIKSTIFLCADFTNSEVLINALKKNNDFIRNIAFTALLQIKDSRLINVILENFNSDDTLFLEQLVKLVGECESARAVLPLLYLLEETNEISLKEQIIEALGKIKNSQAIDKLLTLLDISPEGTQFKIISALANIGDKNVVNNLIPLLYVDNWKLKKQVISALGDLPEPQSLVHLRQIISKSNESLIGWILKSETVLAIKKIKSSSESSDKRSVKEEEEFW